MAKYEWLKSKIRKIIKDNSYYGIRRIKAELYTKYKIIIGKENLGKLLRLWGLSLKRKAKKKKISALQALLLKLKNRTNILIRSIVNRPLQAISSDITEIKYKNGQAKCYLCVHKDVYGQLVYGHDVSEKMQTELVLSSFTKACNYIKSKLKYKQKQRDKIIFHQDQGSQYTSYEYVETVLNFGKISYSTPGTPTDNPGQESFFGRFKEENADEILDLKTLKEVKKFINKKIRYYNNKRIHTSIGHKSPKAFTKISLKI